MLRLPEVKLVPEPITSLLSGLSRETYNIHYLEPGDVVKELFDSYTNKFGWLRNKGQGMDLPLIYALTYQIHLSIPSISQLRMVLDTDTTFASACAFHEQPSIHDKRPLPSLKSFYRMHHRLSECRHDFRLTLHNITEEMDSRGISQAGRIPANWVLFHRPPREYIDWDLERASANNTGIEVIDEVTLDLPRDFRSDVRQEAALKCLELGLDTLSREQIIGIVDAVRIQFNKENMGKRYKERSLFSRPYGDDRELWEFIADPMEM